MVSAGYLYLVTAMTVRGIPLCAETFARAYRLMWRREVRCGQKKQAGRPVAAGKPSAADPLSRLGQRVQLPDSPNARQTRRPLVGKHLFFRYLRRGQVRLDGVHEPANQDTPRLKPCSGDVLEKRSRCARRAGDPQASG